MLSTTTQKMAEIVQNPLEQFQIVPLIPIRSGAMDISFTNSSLMMVLATGAFLTLLAGSPVNKVRHTREGSQAKYERNE